MWVRPECRAQKATRGYTRVGPNTRVDPEPSIFRLEVGLMFIISSRPFKTIHLQKIPCQCWSDRIPLAILASLPMFTVHV